MGQFPEAAATAQAALKLANQQHKEPLAANLKSDIAHFRGRATPARALRPESMFQLTAPFEPAGDQPEAIEALVEGLRRGEKHQVLMGVTGSGKTFTMANVIQAGPAAGAGDVAQQDAGGPALFRVQGVSFPTTPSTISSATTTTISRKPTSPSATSTSRRTPRSTSRSSGCGWRPPAAW